MFSWSIDIELEATGSAFKMCGGLGISHSALTPNVLSSLTAVQNRVGGGERSGGSWTGTGSSLDLRNC